MKILITGVTGNLGVEVTQRLLQRGHHVVGVTNKTTEMRRNDGKCLSTRHGAKGDQIPGIEFVSWDMSCPAAEYADCHFHAMLDNLDAIIHCAAITEFGLPREIYQQLNVQGTRHLIQFVNMLSRRPRHFIHVSTAYVAGNTRGAFPEKVCERRPTFANHYEESKYLAEQVVRTEAIDTVRVSIVRPSIVVGESQCGVIRDFKHLYPLLRVVGAGRIATVAGYYDSSINMVPIDYVADAIVAVAETDPSTGHRTYNCVAPENVSMREWNDILAEFPAIRVPKVIPPDTFYGTRREADESRLYDRVVIRFEPYFNKWARFEYANMDRLAPVAQIPPNQTLVRNLVRYGQSSGYLS